MSSRFSALIGVGLAALLAFGAPAVAGAAQPPAFSVVTATGELSDNGDAAVADLRTCLASSDTLNVYYLVDSSLSLTRADDGGPGSDPGFLRAEILANSLAQLGALDGVAVNWAAGFFADDFSATVGWNALSADGPGQLDAAIRDRDVRGYTNWPAALAGAQRELAAQDAATPGCQMLVWLTDGQIDIGAPDGQQQEDFDALNTLCGRQLDAQGAQPRPGGIFDTFRHEGVIVIGALLAGGDIAAAVGPQMQALVEGQAADGRECGEQPLPDSAVHGAFVNAADPASLAMIFSGLSAQVAGGYPQPFQSDGGFWIDEGVSRFRIVVGGEDWKLIPPTSRTDATDWQAEPNSGVTTIDVSIDDTDDEGLWRLEASEAMGLFLFSDLRIEFEESNDIELSTEGSASTSLVARVRDAAGDAPLDGFGAATFSASYIDAEGIRQNLTGAEVDRATGRIEIPLPAGLNQPALTVTASLDPLTTRAHGLELAPVTASQTITMVLPGDFPRITRVPIELSDLEGASGEAVGVIIVDGPESGASAGEVCIDTPRVISDGGDRAAESWHWSDHTCIEIEPGKRVEVPIAVTNEEAADSFVQATIPVTFTSAAGQTITQDLPVEFRTTHPVNAVAVAGLTALLIVLGLLIPLLLLWLLNWRNTRIDVAANVQRAAFPIVIAADDIRITAPASGSALANAFVYARRTENATAMTDAALGEFRARVTANPFSDPWYELRPRAGTALIGVRSGRGGLQRPGGKGRVRFSRLAFDQFFGIVVPEGELRRTRRGESVTGTVVIYHRAGAAGSSQLADRLREITQETGLVDAVNKARESLPQPRLAETPRGGSGAPSGSAPSGSASAPPRSGAGAPPRPGAGAPPRPGAVPPSRTGGNIAPRADGSAPARPGQVPPPSTGSAPPPPRPGSAPPPRPGGTPPPPRP